MLYPSWFAILRLALGEIEPLALYYYLFLNAFAHLTKQAACGINFIALPIEFTIMLYLAGVMKY